LQVVPSDRWALALAFNRGSNGQLSTTSVELLARLYPTSWRTLRPFLSAGIGWRRFHSPVDIDAVTFPAAVGLSYGRGRWNADARLSVRPASRAALHTIGAETYVGLAF
jgi:hypothetical protein